MLAAIMLVFLLLFRMVIVSGESMHATLWDGDWLLLIGNHFYRNPEPGDIIVACKDSFNDGEPIIKRIIATEGQIVEIDFDNGIVYVDGLPLDEPYIYSPTTVKEGVVFPLIVEKDCIFVLGDNRGVSLDSRSPDIGQIDKREVLGKAIFLLFPGDHYGEAEHDFNRIGAIK
jgi:signal peptidase I